VAVSDLVARLTAKGWSLAVAESLTGGLLASHAARLPDAAQWFRGGLVAYHGDVKRELLSIGDAPVVSESAARTMAEAVAGLLGANCGLAATGVGGPDPEDGVPPGTVWIATFVDGTTDAMLLQLDGGPHAVLEQSCARAVAALTTALS
jgi:nicotinamide-nucleotide amidase